VAKWPVPVKKPEPLYSAEARIAKYQGSVAFRLIVDAEGRTRNITLVRSLGFGLDETAYDAVKTWIFRPATTLSDMAVALSVNIEVNFRLL
jgi:periplasmic protein TonB